MSIVLPAMRSLPDNIARDLQQFFGLIVDEEIDLKSLRT
jgi:hypothetical protein